MPPRLLDGLRHAAFHHGENIAYGFISKTLETQQVLTYQSLYRKVLAAAHDIESHTRQGDRVLLLYPPGLDFCVAFYACLLSGRVAVPGFPPASKAHFFRLSLICEDSGAKWALTSPDRVDQVQTRMAKSGHRMDLTIHSLPCDTEMEDIDACEQRYYESELTFNSENVAFLQYTSGSTGSPKGVEVTHSSILANLQEMDRAYRHDAHSVMVSWLPVFHDMGLVYGVMMPLFKRFPGYLMAPTHFLQRPLDWLQAIQHFRGTHCAAPNFAFELCAAAIAKAEKEGLRLDLSSWRVAVNGAEPIRATTLQRFTRAFADHGLRPETLCPGYGLAEYTLEAVTTTYGVGPRYTPFDAAALERGRAVRCDAGGRILVAVGTPGPTTEMHIVDPVTLKPREQGEVGEIWLRGPSVARGYFADPEKTERVFGGRLDGTSEARYLRTGDLGFVCDGLLYVTGRHKDLIIHHGRNLYPQDLETTVVDCHEALRADGCAATGLDAFDDESVGERLLIVAEVERTALRRLERGTLNADDLFAAIREALARDHELEVDHIVLIRQASLPKTSSGKVRRSACGVAFTENTLSEIARWSRPIAAERAPAKSAETQTPHLSRPGADRQEPRWLRPLCEAVAEVLEVSIEHIDPEQPLGTWGMNSLKAARLVARLSELTGRALDTLVVYDHPTPMRLAAFLERESPDETVMAAQAAHTRDLAEPIAVVGMGCRFPGADGIDAFWHLLEAGVSGVGPLPEGRREPGREVPHGGFLAEVEGFDAAFFGISAAEAELLDPQHRLLLEVTQEAIEHAGLTVPDLAGQVTGVFVGMSSRDYERLMVRDGVVFNVQGGLGTQPALAANRLSYVFDLNGPSMTLDTACSSSLVAVHQAVRALRNGDCDVAIAGGVQLYHDLTITRGLAEGRMLSPDGICRTFDAEANGYVRGEGCGVILLLPLRAARIAGLPVQGQILGGAVNQDGRGNGITAPNGEAQERVIRRALADAGVSARHIGYLETHGTGTPLGDPIECHALRAVLEEGRNAETPCMLGSVKTNVGHLEAAAGMAGLIKTLLALRHRKIPAHLHFRNLNPRISMPDAFRIPDRTTEWSPIEGRRLAGVSSFGLGGTNAHLILAEADAVPADTEPPPERGRGLLLISAKSETALRRLADRYRHLLLEPDTVGWESLCAAAATRRTPFDHRLAVPAADGAAAAQVLAEYLDDAPDAACVSGRRKPLERPRLAFMFTGSGAQYAQMARVLFDTEPFFRQTLQRIDQMFAEHLGASLLDRFFAVDEDQPLHEARFTQPGLFAVEVALAELLAHWGLRAEAVVGHSAGEFAAAYVAGALSLEDAVFLVAERARWVQKLSGSGGMMSVFAERDTVSRLSADLALEPAAFNGPHHVVLSGGEPELAVLAERLDRAGKRHRRLKVDQALHSNAIERIWEPFAQAAARIAVHPPQTDYYSCLTGDLLRAAPDATYWKRHLREPVRFEQALTAMSRDGFTHFLEIGPGQVLRGLAADILPAGAQVFGCLKRGEHDWDMLLRALSELWTRGLPIDWRAFHGDRIRNQRIALPHHPIERSPHWYRPNAHRAPTYREDAMTQPDPQATSTAPVAGAVTATRSAPSSETVLVRLREMIAPLLKIAAEDVEPDQPFLEMGADSLVLVDFIALIERHFGARIRVHDLFEALATPRALAVHVAECMAAAPDSDDEPLPSMAASDSGSGIAAGFSAAEVQPSALAQILTSHERVMAQHHQLMAALAGVGTPTAHMNAAPAPAPLPVGAAAAHKMPATAAAAPVSRNSAQPQARSATAPAEEPTSVSSPVRVQAVPRGNHLQARKTGAELGRSRSAGLDTVQKAHLDELVRTYTERTAESKRRAQHNRPNLADYRAYLGFRFSTKEMLYEIEVAEARGAEVVDIDGNRYLDITMGFGVNLLGHDPEVVQSAIAAELARGSQLGLRSRLAGEVAERFCRLTGMERVAFTSSGTEAVMAAIRLARSARGRQRIVMFEHAYHGHGDAVLARRAELEGEVSIKPVAPGIPPSVVGDTLVLPYGDASALEVIAAQADSLAAVLVEPVQSARPDLQPAAFVRELRRLTESRDVPLILDEMITGFRVHPAGCQGLWGIRADLATYGKALGGGMAIGAVAGCARLMDGIDGGQWCFGDGSYPRVETTFMAGTYQMQAMTMAAARAVLIHLEEAGPQLQQELGARTDRFVAEVNRFFDHEGFPLELVNFGSLFRFKPLAGTDPELFFYHLMLEGVYVRNVRNCFLSTAHDDEDLSRLLDAIRRAAHAMRRGGFFPKAERRAEIDVRDAEEQCLPVSEAQRQLFALAQMEPDADAAYVERLGLTFTGDLDPLALERALMRLVARHDALRTHFTSDGAEQVVSKSVPVRLDHHRLEFESEATGLIDELAAQPLNLDGPALFRFHLVSQGTNRHRLLLLFHHIVVDGLSLIFLLQELGVLYNAERGGRPADLAPAEPLRTYIEAFDTYRHSEAWQEDLAWWRSRFPDGFPLVALPPDRPRGTRFSYRGGRHTLTVPAEIRARVRQLAASAKCTEFMVLFAAYGLWALRLSNSRRATLGVPVSGRRHAGTRRAVGYHAHLLPIAVHVASGLSGRDLLAQVRSDLLAAFSHERAPFAQVAEALGAKVPAGFGGLLNLTFNLDRIDGLPEFEGLDVALLDLPMAHAKVDLHLDVLDDGHDLHLKFEYASIYNKVLIHRFARLYLLLLDGLTRDPARPVLDLPLLTPEERTARCVATSAALPPATNLVTLFEATVRSHPDAPALSDGTHQLTCAALNNAANRLARRLVEAGVAVGDNVPIYHERGLAAVVAILAVLKSGAAYVPLDSTNAPARIDQVLDGLGPCVLVAEPALAERLSDRHGDLRIILDQGCDEVPATECANLDRHIDGDHLAYIIHTSGSTGRPKGVAMSHATAVRYFLQCREEWGFGAGETWACFHSLAFDFSVLELFAPLLFGGRVVMVPYLVSRTPEELVALLERERVNVLCQTPTAFTALDAADAADPGRLNGVHTLVFGGEALSHAVLKGWFARYPHTVVRNIYGATENCVNATWRLIEAGDTGIDRILLGTAMANNAVHVLDDRLEPLPPGVPGECYVGGNGVARGYFGQPALTAARFVPDPSADRPGARLYRTGDLVRRTEDGDLEFLGRVDQQVQLRGFRVELGEIETALMRHPAIKAAAVDLRRHPDGRPLLASWLVGEAGVAFQEEGLRRFLSQQLPNYMIPTRFTTVETLPMTLNGKVDTASLVLEKSVAVVPDHPAVATPADRDDSDPLVRRIGAAWCDVLGLERVGPDDHFYSLGGDSMLALQLANRLREMDLAVTVRDLLTHPTIAELCGALRQRDRNATSAETVPEQARTPFELVSREDRARLEPFDALVIDAVPLGEGQAGIVYHAELAAENAIYHDVLSFRVDEPLDETAMTRAWDELNGHQPILRTCFALTGFDEALQLVARQRLVEPDFSDLTREAPERQRLQIDERVAAEVARPFRLDGGSVLGSDRPDLADHALVRVAFLRLGDDAFQLLISFHHAILDGWSVTELLKDLMARYRTAEETQPELRTERAGEGRTGHLTAPVEAERRAAARPETAAFWRARYAALAPIALPGPSPAAGYALAERGPMERTQVLDATLSRTLIERARQWAVPLKSLLLAVHLRVLADICNSEHPICGLIVPTRREDHEVGLLVNTVPQDWSRAEAPTNQSWRELVGQVSAHEAACQPHRDYPLARLQRELGGPALFESVFNYIHFHGLTGSFENLSDLRFHGFTHFPLLVEFERNPWDDALTFTLQYQRERIPADRIETYAAMHLRALALLADEPDAPHRRAHLLPEIEDERIAAVQPTQRPMRYELVHHFFEHSAAQYPNAIAVIDGQGVQKTRLTFAELEIRANQLAHALIERGAGPERRVGICLDRSVETVVAVLAVLKSGAAYVPLDPGYPLERLRAMIEDASLRLILTKGSGWADTLASIAGGVPLLDLDQARSGLVHQPAQAPRPDLCGSHLAYLIYTSGSTGTPKGVAMPHRVLANLVACQRRATACAPAAPTLWFASLSFDVHHQEMFTAFAGGDPLIVAPESVRGDGLQLVKLLREHSVQRLFLPFVALNHLAQVLSDEDQPLPEDLREIITAGEQLRFTPAIATLLTRLRLCRLVNQYGPSETHVASAWHPGDDAWPDLPPIGRPISNARLWVLDTHMRPVPIGTPGELYIGGPLPARGYWNRPAATAQAFVPDPFSTDGARLYRSGDRVRMLPDGAIEFLGRSDHQVKVRGYRIEPGEIECLLESHRDVAHAVVVPRRDDTGERFLLAYLVPAVDVDLDLEPLRDLLAERLPAWMMPSRFAVIEELPKTPSGKVDRRRLTEGAVLGRELRRPFLEPRTEREQQLADLWAEILGLARVGRDGGFFELGGHSLSATRLVLRLRALTGRPLPLSALFEADSPAAMAEYLDNLDWAATALVGEPANEARVDFEI
ncbi:Amino acid adenylation domain-containing protein [Sulfidibacter corallicola]|uniref:Amino acid adenylation domain-containing protein n=1 Tax=Sulfidibacter corallicola TaxID=2818388 RepID=A0A8A4TT81_SULCO|nr:non-ribosomal peptide synthetase/type I polyketide synthase [Sulfidibacter corallicola]QTD52364.1 amino acid adenylation domain-containing protein [Sulfidibacter corallicola]